MHSILFLAALALVQQPAADDRAQLVQELDAEVRAYQSRLPLRDGTLTYTAVALAGTEIIYTGDVAADFDDAMIAHFRTVVAEGLCSGDATARTIRRGGSFTYRLRDSGGERFVATVSRCGK